MGIGPYVDPARLELERSRVFDRAWLLVGSAESFTRSKAAASVSWRDHARVLVERQASRLVAHAPGGVRLAQWRGLVWVSTHPEPPPLEAYLGQIAVDTAPYALADFVPIRSRSMVLECNWKAPLEISMETYHLDTVHARSIGRLMTPQPPRCERFGDHQRMIAEVADYEWRRWLDARSSRGGPYEGLQGHALHRYLVFPNTVLNVLPSQLSLYTTWPLGPNRCRLDYRFCAKPNAGVIEWARTRLTAMLSAHILREDLAVLSRFQQGVHALATGPDLLHERERSIAWFHEALARWCAAEMSSPTNQRARGAG